MSFTSLLVHRLEVRRRTGRVDRFGQPVDSNPGKLADAPVIGTHACRLTTGSGGLATQERSLDVFVNKHKIFLQLGVDVREDDSVRVLDSRTGEELLPIAKVVDKSTVSDGVGAHHLELDVLVQRGVQ